jgi:predicted nucleotide-binding protein
MGRKLLDTEGGIDMDRERALELLKQCLDEIPKLKELHHGNQDFPLWRDKVRDILKAAFDGESDEYKRFDSALKFIREHWMMSEQQRQEEYIRRLSEYETALKSILQKHEILGAETKEAVPRETPRAFIAHGGKSEALTKLKDFLIVLGVTPLIAEEEPSEGRLVEQQVQKYRQEAHCEIILATRGGIVDKKTGTEHPRLNIIDELGRAREKSPERVVLLLEEEVELPSNVGAIVRERFTQDCMDKAFIKIVRELKAFGLI